LSTTGTLLRHSLDHARVIFCTLSSSGNPILRRLAPPDVLLVDEAGQCTEAELMVPVALNPRNMILVGDPMQLPATLLSHEARGMGRGRSTLQRLMEGSCAYPYHLLSTQYRMHSEISSFSNRTFYGGRIEDSEYVLSRRTLLSNPPLSALHCLWLREVAFVDINWKESVGNSRYPQPWVNKSVGGSDAASISNLGEATLVVKCVRAYVVLC